MTSEVGAVGRPRRFDDKTERSMLIDAAIRVMSRGNPSGIALEEVLAETGLSTRAFYRHFDSKEALLDALRLREAASVGRSLARVVSRAPDPVAALEAWLDRFLDVFHQPRRAERVALLGSEADYGSRHSNELRHAMRRVACEPLIEALRQGHTVGVLHSPTPELDAYSIHELVSIASLVPSGEVGMDREAVRSHVIRFAWPALRIQGTPALLSEARQRTLPASGKSSS